MRTRSSCGVASRCRAGAALVVAAVLLVGCGQKGPLVPAKYALMAPPVSSAERGALSKVIVDGDHAHRIREREQFGDRIARERVIDRRAADRVTSLARVMC
ncbi:MAG: hypothetical protein JNL19_03250 [Burkholderiales bacterium]|nr:hypothetical protein [Burkholderiales bacterium]